MRDFKVFYLRICFVLFMHAEFSNAVKIDISDPDTFPYTSLIHSFFVKRPQERYFTRHPSSRQMFLGLHKDYFTLSFYEKDAIYSYFSFKQTQVDFEIFHAKTMTFSVKDDSGTWHFRCVFLADKHTLDVLYSYLSLCTAQGLMTYRGDIEKVQQYIRVGRMREPIIRSVEDLQPAILYDQVIETGNPNNKVLSIAPGFVMDEEHKISRLVFRTGSFRVKRLEDVVVLSLSGFENWFYIFYFQDPGRADYFVNIITNFDVGQDVALDIPADLLSFIETGMSLADAPHGPKQSSPSPQDQQASPALPTHAPHGSGQPSSSPEDQPASSPQDHPLSLTLPPSWSGKQPRSDRDFQRNVRARSHEDLD